MIKRLIDFYKLTSPNARTAMHIIWQGVTTVCHRELAEALDAGDEFQVQKVLDAFGLGNGFQGIECLDLCDKPASATLEELKARGIDLSIPDCFGYKFQGPGAVIPMRLPIYCRLALKIWGLTGSNPGHVLEFGAGMGLLGLILSRSRAQSYTVIDLPTTAVLSAYFLSCCLGKDHVWLYGEDWNESVFAWFFPATDCSPVPHRKYEVVCSVNCFPEFPHVVQDQYLKLIADCLAPDGFFISVNHEDTVLDQRSVAEAMKRQQALVCISRSPSTIICIPGYFDEIFERKKN